MTNKVKELVSQMTLEEKAGLCSGLDFWHLKGVERLGIPSVMVTDGPHGLRKQRLGADHLGLHDSVSATCFPSAAGMASSWDRSLIERVGIALGEECQAENVAVLLGPGANIKRSPLCGRNFEYFSEDPYLSSEMAANHIKGVQSQGVGTSLKHFAANNQEHRRMSTDAIIDERTLREIYLASFEGAVKQSQPWTVMCAYNKVNGEFASESKTLLEDILKEEWGFEGFVVSDWGAVNERDEAVKNGLELEMPASQGIGENKVIAAVKEGRLSEEKLNAAVERIVRIILKSVEEKKENASYDWEAHHQLAREAARESMVLLKNEGQFLPLKKEGKIAVIGEFAKAPRYQGGGSSHINPTKLEDIVEEVEKVVGEGATITYAQGYHRDQDTIDEQLIEEAKRVAADADTVILFVGLPDRYESEGYDRQHLNIPENHQRLIEEVATVNENIVAVLSNGAPIEMPWLGKVKGLLEAYLGGQALGGAIADLLFGDVNPSGKLAETFPERLSDNPSYLYFPGDGDRVEYREGIYVGYRYYDTKKVKPLFPFGFGLSYTTFDYENLTVSQKKISDTDFVTCTVQMKNTGSVSGKEVVQLYVKDVESRISRPDKELKGFAKVDLRPGEEKTVEFTLDKRSFAYYDTELADWHVESGDFTILIGRNSNDIVLSEMVTVESMSEKPFTVHRNTTVGDLLDHPKIAPLAKQMLAEAQKDSPFASAAEEEGDAAEMMAAMMRYMPLRALSNFSNGQLTEERLQAMISHLNEAVNNG
ncbi:glycoside hydrolase family 3 C-terminal domain-containing protein [Halalkalibacter sp. AB-rgal2]|uniref:glycoside hydrolase family 3 C-terminal domain-containing protein n=1 Tax=Halalkalibacter sp. AB-rgal2 TaxID=3242695 RepID=UPI00359D5583